MRCVRERACVTALSYINLLRGALIYASFCRLLTELLEAALTDLKNQPQSYSVAQQCLVYSSNSMVHFFAVRCDAAAHQTKRVPSDDLHLVVTFAHMASPQVQVLEEWATRRWDTLPDAEKVRVRTTLLQFYTEKFATLAPYVYNKIAKVVADIGTGSLYACFPSSYPRNDQGERSTSSISSMATKNRRSQAGLAAPVARLHEGGGAAHYECPYLPPRSHSAARCAR